MKDNLKNIDPAKFLIETNIELATRFTPQMKQFIQELSSANGRPVLFHLHVRERSYRICSGDHSANIGCASGSGDG